MPFDPTDPNSFAANQMTSPLAGMAQDRATGMLNQPQLKVFARPQSAPFQDAGTNFTSPIMPTQTQLGNMMPGTLAMAKGGAVNGAEADGFHGDELATIKDAIRKEFTSRGLDFDKFVSNPAVMDEVGRSLAKQGQGGDTILAHINPEEAALLKEHGGSGSINPHTGLPQFLAESDASYGGGGYGYGQSNYGSGGGGDTSGGWSTGYGGGGDGNRTSSFLSGFTGGGSSPVGVSGYSFSDTGAPAYTTSGGDWSAIGGGGGGFGNLGFGDNTISPLGAGSGSVSLGSGVSPNAEASPSLPSFANINPSTGLPIGASTLSGIGQVATMPSGISLPSAAIAERAAPAVNLSDVNFTDMNAGVAPNAYIPGGVSNYAGAPTEPGYTDIGTTAMRMAAGMPQGEGARSQSTEFNLGKLGEFDPVAQTQAATILNRMMDQGYAPGFDPFGVGRTMAEQAALKAAAGPYLTAEPGKSFHNYGLAMDVENLNDAGYRDLARIAREEGWGSGGALDPAHVQMGPWGAGAMQTAARLGASPVTTPATQVASAEPSTLKSALNTVSNIASELFGAKPAQAEEAAPARDYLGNLYEQTQPFGGEEIMSPFVGTRMGIPAASQQQMLDVLGIAGLPERPVTSNMFGMPFATTKFGDVIPQAGFTTKEQGRAPSAPSLSAPSVAATMAAPSPLSRFGAPEDMATYGGEFTDVGYPRAGLDVFGLSGPTQYAPEAVSRETSTEDTGEDTYKPYPQVPLDPNSYQNYKINPDFAYQKMLAALGWRSMFAPPKEEAIAKMTTALERSGSMYDPTTGIIYAQDPSTMRKALGQVPIELKDNNGNVVGKINAAEFLTPIETPVRTVPLPPERPISFEETPTSVTPVPTPDYTPSSATMTPLTKPISTEQSKQTAGYYDKPLEKGETIRENFNEAFADAAAKGLKEFSWKNPATGVVGQYKVAFNEGGRVTSPLVAMGKK